MVESLVKKFHERFGKNPILIAAPGRINLIGEHIDYNNGIVLPCAIQLKVYLAMASNDSGKFRCYSEAFGLAEFGMNELRSGHHWSNYVMGVIDGFKRNGFAVGGFDLVVERDLPLGAGLSSSAALCCGIAFGISILNNAGISRLNLAYIAQHAEHVFAGVRTGIMDQYASLFGKKDCALLLDCQSMMHEYVNFKLVSAYSLLLVNSGVSHQLASTEYNIRRKSCEQGMEVIAASYPVSSLRDVTPEMLTSCIPDLDQEVYRRCLYVIEEIKRTSEAARDLRAGDLKKFGAKMFETHEGLSKQYEVSCPETDLLVDLAKRFGMVLGSRMMGGGFGGCTLNLIGTESIDDFKTFVGKNYFAQFKKEPEFYQVTVSDGVCLIDQPTH